MYFSVTKDVLSKAVVNLVADGLDTIASVNINQHSIGESSNMFRRYVFDVKEALKVSIFHQLLFY